EGRVATPAPRVARAAHAHLGRGQAGERRPRARRLRALLPRRLQQRGAAPGVRGGAARARRARPPRRRTPLRLPGPAGRHRRDPPRRLEVGRRPVGLVPRGRERALLPVAHHGAGAADRPDPADHQGAPIGGEPRRGGRGAHRGRLPGERDRLGADHDPGGTGTPRARRPPSTADVGSTRDGAMCTRCTRCPPVQAYTYARTGSSCPAGLAERPGEARAAQVQDAVAGSVVLV
ncbi:MAG: hypothetical protein AVDCRST_MAG40-1169, partial [uncultured Gemmatimonadaceae bacterium]